jgi:hypothetical protein
MMNTGKRGFASLSRDRLREIAQQGGQAAHRKGTAHEFTVEEARAAGRKGGSAISQNRAHMAAIGRKGGQRSASPIRSSARTVREPQ